MGEVKEMKKFVDISGFNINQPNRGNAALSYGAVSFLVSKGLLKEGQELVLFRRFRNPLSKRNLVVERNEIIIDGVKWVLNVVPVFFLEWDVAKKYGYICNLTRFGRYVNNTEYEAADYGGDGFADIYGDKTFRSRMHQTDILMAKKVPLIMLPMTIGPFEKEYNRQIADKYLRYASKIYVRDDRFCEELKKMGLEYEHSIDLSAYMKPEPWDIDISDNAIGINISGLAYSNNYGNLVGQFDAYPKLVERLICTFRDKGHTVYLIPHSYNYTNPEKNNDDMVACKAAYNALLDKSNVVFVDKDLTSPQVKYVISKMKFFIGTRMHANFAAIYTNVPLFGLAYSYKFAGAFNANGLDGSKQTILINNLEDNAIDSVIYKINSFYEESQNELKHEK